MFKPYYWQIFTAAIIIASIPIWGHGEISTDGTLGPATTLSGPDFQIGHELGTTVSNNLFHSFQQFSIHAGESATFTGPEAIEHVVSRVTGGSASLIDGRLAARIGTADVYFINPSGVVFGPQAQVDVPGAFHSGTADELRFADGSIFSAADPAASTLSAEAPQSFGYLGRRSASLVVHGSRLTFMPESHVSLSGGEIVIAGDETNVAEILVPGGELRISAMGDAAGDVPLIGPLNSGAGECQVADAMIWTSGDGGGQLRISAGESAVVRSLLTADNTGAKEPFGGLDISVTGTLEVADSWIQSSVFGAGASGGLRVAAAALSLFQTEADTVTGLFSQVAPDASGDAGGVAAQISGAMTLHGGVLIDASSWGSGCAGDVEIEAGNLYIDAQSGIYSTAESDFSGHAGRVTIKVADSLELLGDSVISSSTWSAGDAGDVVIEAGNLYVDGQSGIFSASESSFSGHAGSVTIGVADWLELRGDSRISSHTWGAGDGGDVAIEAGSLYVDGQSHISSSTFGAGDAGDVAIEAGDIYVDGQSVIGSGSGPNSRGRGGRVTIGVADSLEVLRGGQISSSTFGAGDAGDMAIEAGDIYVDGQSAIVSTAQPNSSGHAGRVTIGVADTLELLGGSWISSSTFGAGDAGSIAIDAGEILIDGQDKSQGLTYIASASVETAQGFAGDVVISTDQLTVQNGGGITIEVQPFVSEEKLLLDTPASLVITSPVINLAQDAWISASSLVNVPAAAIDMVFGTLRVFESSITTSAFDADGGPITLQGEIVDLHDSLVSSSVWGSSGDGGDITITGVGSARALILSGGFIQANAPAGARGGDIYIDTTALIPEGMALEIGGSMRQGFELGSERNVIQAAAEGGEQGTIEITAPQLDISGSMVNLDARFFEAVQLADDPCSGAGGVSGGSLFFGSSGDVIIGPDEHESVYFNKNRLKRIVLPDEDLDSPAVPQQ